MSGFTIDGHGFSAPTLTGGLYIVSTPIGNLADVTIRALQTLSAADVIACEDTRVTAKLLQRYGIKTKRISYHEHNADKEGPVLLEAVRAGKAVALVSDAGTPLISDPGQRLVGEAKSLGLPVTPVPGVCAPVTALTASGLPTDLFTFAGFLPSKQGQRIKSLQAFKSHVGTLVFFEGPSRLVKSLTDMVAVFGAERKVCICRELTKMHEEALLGTLHEVQQYYEKNPPKGEIVIVLAPETENKKIDSDQLLRELLETMSVSRAAGEAAKLTGLAKRDLYAQALKIADE